MEVDDDVIVILRLYRFIYPSYIDFGECINGKGERAGCNIELALYTGKVIPVILVLSEKSIFTN